MTRVRNWFLVAAIAAVGFACGSDGGSNGTGGSGGSAGASGKGGIGSTGVAGSHGGAGTSGAAGTTGGAGFGGGFGGAGGPPESGGGAGAGGHAGSGGSAGGGGGAGGQAGSGGGTGPGGHAGGGGGAGGSGNVCGGIAGLTCKPFDEFCDFGNGQCGAGDQQGQCELSGGALCLQQVVCGCDGHTYPSACQAHANGVDTMSTTSCIPGNGGTGAPCGQDTDCISGYKCCENNGTVGSPIACRQIPAGGSCPMPPSSGRRATRR